MGYTDEQDLKECIYDILRFVKDPEKPQTLEDLNVISEEMIFVEKPTDSNVHVVSTSKGSKRGI